MRIAAFISHPIQYFTPLWQEISNRPGVELTVFYFSRHGLDLSEDAGFGRSFAWDIDLLAGHKHVFLPRQWPTEDLLDHKPRALNKGILPALRQGWDAAFVGGYAHINNWLIVAACHELGIPVLCFGDTTLRASLAKTLPKRAIKRVLLTAFMRRVSAFLAAGGQTRLYFQHYGAKTESIFVCPYAVDVARFREASSRAGADGKRLLMQRWGISEGKQIVVFCGKLASWKRPLDLILAVKALNRRNVIALFVGDGTLRNEILRTGGDCARVTGFVNQSEIPIALSLADVLVLPSSFEPYGMVVAEAQCLGVPAIVSDACGCHGADSVLQDGVSGFVFPTGDVSALAAKLAALLDDDSLRTAMGEQAKRQGERQSQIVAADAFLAAVQYAQQQRPSPRLYVSHVRE